MGVIVNGLCFVWNGSHTVNVYEAYQVPNAGTEDHPAAWCRGAEIDVFSVGDFADEKASVEEVRQGISDYARTDA